MIAWIACRAPDLPEPGTPDDLATYLRTVAGADEATRTREVASWIIGDATWNATIVAPWHDLYADYVRGFDAAAPEFVARLAQPLAITTRRHFAGDPHLTPGQERLRWAVPVLFPSVVAELGGAPIDTVFFFDRGHWRALIGVDELVLARVRALDALCAARLDHVGSSKRCAEIGWVVVDSALRVEPSGANRERFTHACRLASSLCGTGSK